MAKEFPEPVSGKCGSRIALSRSKISRHRPWCGSRLLLALFVLLWATSTSCLAEHSDLPFNLFEHDIKDFEASDKVEPPPQHGTVFVGSSTFTKWTSLESEFREFKAINRGFGGSTIPDINYYVDRIVTKYHPNRIVFYAGTNDIAEGHSGKRVSEDFEKFAQKVQAALPGTEVYFVSMSMAPSRVKWASEYEVGNDLIHCFTKNTPHFHYIDVTPVMHDRDGKPREDFFLFDRLHMTPAGYAAWKPIIRQALLGTPDESAKGSAAKGRAQ